MKGKLTPLIRHIARMVILVSSAIVMVAAIAAAYASASGPTLVATPPPVGALNVSPAGMAPGEATATPVAKLFLPVVLRAPTPTPTATPNNTPLDGAWLGATNRNLPATFFVTDGGTRWHTFKVDAPFQVGGCSGTIGATAFGPGAIVNRQFSGSGYIMSFTGQFDSATAAHGTYTISQNIQGCGYFSQSGTWAASPQAPPTPTMTPTITATPTATSTPTPSWQIEVVDAAGDVGKAASLALGADGQPHVGYFDATNKNVKYAFKDATGWRSEVVRNLGWSTPDAISLQLDASGTPHIAFVAGDKLWYAYRDLEGWRTESPDASHTAGYAASLMLDQSGNPHMAYLEVIWNDDIQRVQLRYAYRDGSGWHTETVDTTGLVGYHVSLALDQSDAPHIVYSEVYQSPTSRLKYAYLDNAGWRFQDIYSFGSASWNMESGTNSLALDANDRPHAVFSNTSTWGLTYLYQDTAGWHQESADGSSGSSGFYPSLALDAAGWPHASHYNASYENLIYTYKDLGGWHSISVDTAGDVGRYSSLALDAAGHAHIVYYDATSADLKHAYQVEP